MADIGAAASVSHLTVSSVTWFCCRPIYHVHSAVTLGGTPSSDMTSHSPGAARSPRRTATHRARLRERLQGRRAVVPQDGSATQGGWQQCREVDGSRSSENLPLYGVVEDGTVGGTASSRVGWRSCGEGAAQQQAGWVWAGLPRKVTRAAASEGGAGRPPKQQLALCAPSPTRPACCALTACTRAAGHQQGSPQLGGNIRLLCVGGGGAGGVRVCVVWGVAPMRLKMPRLPRRLLCRRGAGPDAVCLSGLPACRRTHQVAAQALRSSRTAGAAPAPGTAAVAASPHQQAAAAAPAPSPADWSGRVGGGRLCEPRPGRQSMSPIEV